MNKIGKIFTSILVALLPVCAYAQDGAHNAYSPYSVYGLGDILPGGNSYTRTMGGVGVATRNHRYINFMNPAAITARDTLSFMADFTLLENNKVYRQNSPYGKLKSANNTFNISDIVFSFPIYRSSAFMIGIAPFSEVGYDFSSIERDPSIIGNTNNITYKSYGEGGVYQMFIGAGATFWKRLSIGAELIYYFGTTDKITNTVFTDGTYRTMNAGYETAVRSIGGKFGIQYEQRLKNNVSLTIGATYRPKTKLRGQFDDYCYAVTSELADTLRGRAGEQVNLRDTGLSIGDELGVGVSLKAGDNWSVEFNYLRSDWRSSKFDGFKGFGVNNASGRLFTSSVSNSFRAGFEYVPNRNDIRYYYRRMSYRGGVYYGNEYYKVGGNRVDCFGITLGITLPVYKWYNGLSIGVDFGQRGNLRSGNMIRERYATIVVGFNLHDIWFQKPQYN